MRRKDEAQSDLRIGAVNSPSIGNMAMDLQCPFAPASRTAQAVFLIKIRDRFSTWYVL